MHQGERNRVGQSNSLWTFGKGIAVVGIALWLSACGGGGAAPAGAATAGQHSVLTATRGSAPLASCPNGGISVDAGIDTNSNGVLDAAEVTSTQYVCNGTNATNGTNGANALVAVTAEPVGANCASGGKKVSVGLDANANSVLDSGEITSTDYVCNGATGAAGPGITWVNVSGTSVQAVSNTGYLANNAAQVTVTLPLAPAVGDVVQVSGIGAGGWIVAQNIAQYIITKDLPGSIGAVWTARDAVRNWNAVASSADGSKLVAAVNTGQLYTSIDSGASWTARDTARLWTSVASSADGSKLVATTNGGQLYTSIDSGVNWTARDSARNWQSVASSADGSKLVAAVFGGQLYTSIDSGVSWTPRDSARMWYSVASSTDGAKLVAAVYGGQLYTSADSGATWVARDASRSWFSVASSADGAKLIAANNVGLLYTSIDSGANWTGHDPGYVGVQGLASSADGTKLVAAVNGGKLLTSTDSGVTWMVRDTTRNWYSIASSADGTKLVAGVYGSQIYTSIPTAINSTTLGVAGSIGGAQYDALDLQYIGNATFMVRGYAGNLAVK